MQLQITLMRGPDSFNKYIASFRFEGKLKLVTHVKKLNELIPHIKAVLNEA